MPESEGQISNTAAAESAESRTARLLEQLLQIARSSALEEMASGFAHELNQPIGAITTFAQAGRRMLERPEPMVQPAAEVLQHISAEALNAGQGIRRIRGLFNGRDASRERCAMEDAIRELLPLLELLAQRRDIRVSLEVEAELPEVCIDRLRIQHVLFTLFENALDVTPRAGAPAQVRIRLTGDRYGVRVGVHDQGPGIADDVREQVFRPFFTTKLRGTGLGLASSRAIVESHEGSIGFDCPPGQGCCFWFKIPAAAT